MKKYFPAIIFFALIISSCKNEESEKEKEKKSKKISSRDYSISKQNAYSDIFLDSNTVAAFVDTLQVDDKIKRRITSFYNARNYQFAWFSNDGLHEQARGFWNLYHYDVKYGGDSLTNDKSLIGRMDRLFAADDIAIQENDKSFIATELKLTLLFIEHTLETYEDGFVKRKEMERFIPVKKTDAVYLADSLLNKKHNDDKYFEDVHEAFKKLKVELGKYVQVAKQGGWPVITTTEKKLKAGMQGPEILALKRRLQLTGQLSPSDTTDIFDSSLVAAVKIFQTQLGLTQDGVANAALIKELNVPVNERIKQILINLNRMRWMPSRPNGELMLVNIPEFVLHVKDGDKKVFDMNVVVGKDGHSTMMFTDDLNQIVFSPYWNVPPSIVKNEILPAMDKNPNYLASHNMEIVSQGSNLPEIRQLPGPGNSLGKVKFLFPNSFNIYFHDTPAKSLFNRDKRAFSHGCIRLAEPMKLAQYLLRNEPEWTDEKISAAMNSGDQKFVKLKKAVPVFITYYTAWVDDSGLLNFRDDIYGHDKKVAAKAFVN